MAQGVSGAHLDNPSIENPKAAHAAALQAAGPHASYK
jgi:hypothetical protein